MHNPSRHDSEARASLKQNWPKRAAKAAKQAPISMVKSMGFVVKNIGKVIGREYSRSVRPKNPTREERWKKNY